MAYNFSKNNQKYCEGCRTYIPFGLFISSHLNFFSFTADDAKQEDGCANDRNASKLSYSTNDLSNISPLDVNFTKDLKEPDKLNNGNVNTDNKIEIVNKKTEINDNTSTSPKNLSPPSTSKITFSAQSNADSNTKITNGMICTF